MSQSNFGNAIGNGFVLNEATLMIGPMGTALDLTEEEHSIGLFKNLAVANDKTFQPLTQGTAQDIVAQVKTGDNWTISGNGYEYNPRTIMYALGQSGYTSNPTAPRVRAKITAPASIGESEITVAAAAGITAGDWIVLYSKAGNNDGLAYKVKTVLQNAITIDRPLVVAAAVNDEVVKSTLINTNDPEVCSGVSYFAAKIVSSDINCNPIILVAPKVQVTSGLNLAFGVSDYANIAYQLSAMAVTRSEEGYELYRAHGKSKVFLIT